MRAAALTLATVAIILFSCPDLGRVLQEMHARSVLVDDTSIPQLSPLA